MNFLDQLNEAQQEAAAQVEGAMMIIAGAGSGKTRVLTYRIAHLIDLGVDPFNILALTFTNKAAKEMKGRIGSLIGDNEAKNIWMGTFHSVFARILRIEAEKINYPRNFTIYDTQDSKSLLKTIVKELALDDKIYKPGTVYNRISSAKNNLIGPESYRDHLDIMADDRSAGRPRMADIYTAYANRCYRAGAMDFDDLLYKTNVLLRDHPEVMSRYQDKFKFIMVDEYQDTNFSQYMIVKKLAARYQNICVVGDDAQSIYAFRGANIQNILNFKKDYPDYKLYKLEQNYRSTKNIVAAANSVIDKNKDQIEKVIWTANDEGKNIKVHRAQTDNDEGYFVANHIFETKQLNQAENLDFAILYRTNAQSRSFEEALRKIDLPYKIYGGLSFYQRKEIKDLLAYCRLTANPNDEEALKRVINYPARGIGKTTMEKVVVAANKHDKSLWDALDNPAEVELNITGATRNKISDFLTMIKSFRAQMETTNAYDLGQLIAKSSGLLGELYQDKSPEGVARYENIQELLSAMKEFADSQENQGQTDTIGTLSDFLIDVALLTDADQESDDKDHITLMTIHAAKGLEFPFVHIVGMEENLFPSQLSLNSRPDLEEERRLFYVALTRAEKKVTLSYALSRFKWGQLVYCEPSRFIKDIDEQYLELPPDPKTNKPRGDFSDARGSYFGKKTTPGFTRKLKPLSTSKTPAVPGDDTSNLQAGMEVMHDRFGKGKVLKIEGDSPNQKATVFFPGAGQKQLLLKFARLEIISAV